jgi:hypothetical protein
VECRSYWKLQLYQPSTVQNKSWLSIWEWPSQYSIDVNQLTEEDYNKAIAQLKNEYKKLYQNLDTRAQIDDSGYVKFLKSYAEYLIRKTNYRW